MSLLKKSTISFCLAGVLIGLCGCDAIYRILQKEGAEEKDIIGEVLPFESNPRVEEVQKLLKLYGYSIGNVDGRIGPNTRLAIKKFQEDNGIKVSRFIDHATWAQLHIFEASGLIVEGEINTVAVQKALKNAGFSPGKIDGRYGPQTDKSLKAFQKAMGLRADGRIGYRTLRELDDFLPEEY